MSSPESQRHAFLLLGEAIVSLRRVSPLRGAQERNSDAFDGALLEASQAKTLLLEAYREAGEPVPRALMALSLPQAGGGPNGVLWGHALREIYGLRDLRQEVSMFLTRQGLPTPDDLPDPRLVERLLEGVPRAALPWIFYLPMSLLLLLAVLWGVFQVLFAVLFS